MSKVIKYAQWKETPRSIEAPAAPSKPRAADDEPEVDEEALARLMEEISAKEQRAKEMIKDPDISIKDVCTKVGYSDPNYFSRIFKKAVGMTPTEYRTESTK